MQVLHDGGFMDSNALEILFTNIHKTQTNSNAERASVIT
jgi:hypothetical protein